MRRSWSAEEKTFEGREHARDRSRRERRVDLRLVFYPPTSAEALPLSLSHYQFYSTHVLHDAYLRDAKNEERDAAAFKTTRELIDSFKIE